MNCTQMIRKYCEERPGQLIDVGAIHKERFEMIPYKTLSKCLGMLENEGRISTVRSGVYRIKGELDSDAWIASYVDDGRGMIIGYGLYPDLGITESTDDILRFVTNAIAVKRKNLAEAVLEKMDISYFGRDERLMIALLELIRNATRIEVWITLLMRSGAKKFASVTLTWHSGLLYLRGLIPSRPFAL